MEPKNIISRYVDDARFAITTGHVYTINDREVSEEVWRDALKLAQGNAVTIWLQEIERELSAIANR